MYRSIVTALCIVLAPVALAGCGDGKPASTGAPAAPAAPALPASVIDAAQPAAAATPIKDLKASAKAGDTVTIRALVGGRVDPIVAGRAIMTVVDAAFPGRCDEIPGDTCKTPWDFCCVAAEELGPHQATVQIVDADGAPLKADLAAGPITPLTIIVLTGVVGERPDDGTLVVNARSVFVEQAK